MNALRHTAEPASAAPAEHDQKAGATGAAQPLPTPGALKEAIALAPSLQVQIAGHRQTIRDILDGRDSRLLVVMGPCSIHDRDSALDYARRLKGLADEVADSMVLVMRVYVEKPRTTVGWKGLVYDPHLDGSDNMAEGLASTRRLMRDITELGLPIACELLQPMLSAYMEDLISWAAVGARTTESQIHREMVSALPMPTGFKNGTDGGIQVAIDAMGASRHGHRYPGFDDNGCPALLHSSGNSHTHLVLRGGHWGPNFDAQSVEMATGALRAAGVSTAIMVDCSHANSGKDPARQPLVLDEVIRQRLDGASSLVGVMLESHLEAGKQALGGTLRYGVSVTDGCLGWTDSEHHLRLAAQRLSEQHI
ncbi:3-deoxy-7-phosphoheptulonate synthase [Kushneria indalinina]|uniref:Phospho-2-dehydro-3-deoxyheptonate aldolase n=1 Tax=Kushneria indalinina DSM 14324 TaxID=1122140 RepID=A0A3D9DTQ5_9GAMM|nr:3-deoxy-7-phosphoheptulonate synthase [Kushneria indalinina]REC94102.1 3-deoxy-D-arabinoheptulosonate-7-phosphate synthase [Kushneria indalinina DSM 14324]